MSEKLISPSAQSVVKLKENAQKQWEVTYKYGVLYTSPSREDASSARFRIIRAMNGHAQECETIAEERGRQAERVRITAQLNARKQTAAVSETRAQQNNKPHIAIVYHNEIEVWDEAINIVNQTE